MSEIEVIQDLESFRERFEEGLDELLEMAEFLLDKPQLPDPCSLGYEEKTFDELSEDEKEIIKRVIFKKLGIVENKLPHYLTRQYSTVIPMDFRPSGLDLPETQTLVSVYKTDINNIFLQELHFLDKEIRWLIGPDQDI